MRNYYSRRKSREHITTVAFIILLLLFLFLYAKASSSSSPAGIHHHSTHGSLKKPRVFDPKPHHDLNDNAASRGSRIYTNEGGVNVFEDGKRRVFTGPNPLHNR
ncbi:CLAVATA3/ESR [Hirschfeldia incana]|nr:CLAVATA3/ESR [Hirschfeldia incana]